MKLIHLLKNNGIFFTAAFVIWMTIMIVIYAAHPYFPDPLPNQLQQMQSQQQAQQGQQTQNSGAQQ
jgi:hypothetical protein